MVEKADKIISMREKIDIFAQRLQAGVGAHSTTKQELIELCREYALSVRPSYRCSHIFPTYEELCIKCGASATVRDIEVDNVEEK